MGSLEQCLGKFKKKSFQKLKTNQISRKRLRLLQIYWMLPCSKVVRHTTLSGMCDSLSQRLQQLSEKFARDFLHLNDFMMHWKALCCRCEHGHQQRLMRWQIFATAFAYVGWSEQSLPSWHLGLCCKYAAKNHGRYHAQVYHADQV